MAATAAGEFVMHGVCANMQHLVISFVAMVTHVNEKSLAIIVLICRNNMASITTCARAGIFCALGLCAVRSRKLFVMRASGGVSQILDIEARISVFRGLLLSHQIFFVVSMVYAVSKEVSIAERPSRYLHHGDTNYSYRVRVTQSTGASITRGSGQADQRAGQ